jgi:aminoglycoside phosphotransferase (APT) family kinase protein
LTQESPSFPSLDVRAAAAIARVPEWQGRSLRYRPAAAPVASPLHRAIASDCLVVEPLGSDPVFLKIRHADMVDDILPQAAAAARKAAGLGIGPPVVLEREGLLGLTYLPEPWRYARVGDLQASDLLAAVIDAKRRLHRDTLLNRRFCPFARIDALAAQARDAGVALPDDFSRLIRAMGLVQQAVDAAGMDLCFCHNDGIASNIMIGGPGVRLVDFDLAGDNDPWFDVGALINEVCSFDAERRAVVEQYAAGFEERLFNRCRLYGAVDDVMWGLWGVTRAVTSPRREIDFWKYGTWRLLHARTTVGARDFEMWLRRL